MQIAHIRSETPDGPRYDPDYPVDHLNSEENLLLLCGKHHTPVDQNESVFTTDELLEWKVAQRAQVGGTEVSDGELANLMRTLESTLSAMRAALQIAVDVSAAGGRAVHGRIMTMPLEGLTDITVERGEDVALLIGARVVNKGSADVDITSAGVEIDVGVPNGVYATWIFDGPWCTHAFPYRLLGRSTAYWYVDSDVARWTVRELANRGKAARRFRSFADLGDNTRVTGDWVSASFLPV